MEILKIIGRIWEFISRAARVIVEVDNFLIEAKAFWDWITGNEPIEPEEK